MPEYRVIVWYVQSRAVKVTARGPKSAATKALKVAGEIEPTTQKVDGAEVFKDGEPQAEGWYFERAGGKWAKDNGGWLD